MDVCKTDLAQAARLLQEAATYIQARARSAREADNEGKIKENPP